MSVWMKIDEGVVDMDEIRLLAKRLEVSYGDALLMLMRVWRRLYKRAGSPLSPDEIDAVSGRDGFCQALLSEGVALGEPSPDGIRVKGAKRAEKYGAYLAAQKANSSLGVRARGTLNVCPDSNVNPDGNQVGHGLGSHFVNPVLYLSDLRSESDPDPERARRVPDPAKVEAEAWLEWFNRKFARQFRVNSVLVKQVKALLLLKASQTDMRGVAILLRDKWEGDAEMAQYLVPSSILRARQFPERLDEAREKYPQFWEVRDAG